MTHGVPLTIKEAQVLYNLYNSSASPHEMDMTDEEFFGLGAKLRAGPVPRKDILIDRMKEAEAQTRATVLGPYRTVSLDIVESGVRVTARSRLIPPGSYRCHMRICPWTEIVMCRINPLLRHIAHALESLDQ